MSFVNNDSYWLKVKLFLQNNIKNGDKIIASKDFKDHLLKEDNHSIKFIYSYSEIYENEVLNYQWIIVHKGMIGQENFSLINFIKEKFYPVFANEVFVVFSSSQILARVSNSSPHLKSLYQNIRLKTNMNTTNFSSKIKNPIKKVIRKIVESSLNEINTVKTVKEINNERTVNDSNSVYLGNNKALTRTIWGAKIFVDTRDISLTPHILLDGYWEIWITNFIKRKITDGMTIVEVGANIGYYTLLMGSMIGHAGKIYAFEANPSLFDILFENIAINGFLDNIHIVNKAVYSHSKQLKFNMLKRHHGSGSIIDFSAEFINTYREEMDTIEVNSISLDEYFTKESPKIDLIKIDAEGSEPFIFKGMVNLINSNPKLEIICEFAPLLISGVGENPREFLEQIKSYGFQINKIETNSEAVEASIDELLQIPQCDLFLNRKNS